MLLQLQGYPPQRQALRGTPFFIIRSINIPAVGSKPCEESHNIYIYIFYRLIYRQKERKRNNRRGLGRERKENSSRKKESIEAIN
jgi:hypothetical protein